MRWQCNECDDVGYISRFLRLTLRMYGFVGWKDRGTMVVREGRLSRVAERTVKGFDGGVILLDVFAIIVCLGDVVNL